MNMLDHLELFGISKEDFEEGSMVATAITKILDEAKLSKAGFGLTLATAAFLASIEGNKAGTGDTAKDLFIRGVTEMYTLMKAYEKSVALQAVGIKLNPDTTTH